jgi:hypothetical protein
MATTAGEQDLLRARSEAGLVVEKPGELPPGLVLGDVPPGYLSNSHGFSVRVDE